MDLAEYQKMAQFEKTYWWYKGKHFLLGTLIQKYFANRKDLNILEIGSGTGEVTKYLSQFGNVTGFDNSEEAIKICNENGLQNVFLADAETLDITPYKNKFDLIVMLDVLEHIQDDLLVMKKAHQMLKDDGLFFINVPAHKFLWSEHDEALHHKRRYHSVELLGKLKDANFTVLKKTYFVCLFFPVIVMFRFWNNIFGKTAYPKTSHVTLPPKINDMLGNILMYEASFIKDHNIPVGVTLTVVAKKNV